MAKKFLFFTAVNAENYNLYVVDDSGQVSFGYFLRKRRQFSLKMISVYRHFCRNQQQRFPFLLIQKIENVT